MRLADVLIEARGRAVIARLTGEMDLSNATNIRQAITQAVPNDALVLVLDLSDIGYLDSSGIQLIYQLRDSVGARGQHFRLVIPASSPANYALILAGVARHLQTMETVDDALGDVTGLG
jgi:anti-anti-sigma factor